MFQPLRSPQHDVVCSRFIKVGQNTVTQKLYPCRIISSTDNFPAAEALCKPENQLPQELQTQGRKWYTLKPIATLQQVSRVSILLKSMFQDFRSPQHHVVYSGVSYSSGCFRITILSEFPVLLASIMYESQVIFPMRTKLNSLAQQTISMHPAQLKFPTFGDLPAMTFPIFLTTRPQIPQQLTVALKLKSSLSQYSQSAQFFYLL